ncbi:MAG: SurA N-terminal domain-containing protein [Gammaproteobacteria bacterium]|nr:SurA N-terminal domain-containing protein [Gammaproteobacteria bacterium]
MLEKIRDGSQGIVAKSILGVVILSFALAGIGSYLGSSSEVPAAVVNGTEISSAKLEQKFQQERSRLEGQFGEMFKAISSDNAYMASIRQSVLERLIADELIEQMAAQMGLRVGNDEIKQAIFDMPEFQIDGVFDNDRYLSLVRRAGYRVEQFREMLRVDMTRQQLMAAVVGSDFVLESEGLATALLEQQQRDIRFIAIKAQDFNQEIVIADQQVSDYYELNNGQFKTQELLSLEYVELKVADLLAQVTVSDEAVQVAYDENIASYQTDARRKVAHILIEIGDDQAVAMAKAQAILDRVTAGEDFAALAAQLSDDTFSGENGGDLDWIEPGVMDPEFEQAAFALGKGQVSGLVKSSFGYHLIKVTDLEAQVTQPFIDVAATIRQELEESEAKELFFEVQQQLADVSFEVPENLEEAAIAIGAKVKDTSLFTRSTVPAHLNYPELLTAAYSDAVLIDQVNSDVIEITADHHIVVRVKEHKPSEIKPLTEVNSQIVNFLKNQQAVELAKTKAQEYLAQWNSGSEIADVTVSEKKGLTRDARDVAPEIVSAAFSLAKPVDGQYANALVTTSSGQAIVSLVKVTAATAVEEQLIPVLARLQRTQSDVTYRAFITSLKNASEVTYPTGQ